MLNSALGKETNYTDKYDASLLFRIPRNENRIKYGIDSGQLPFVGYDVWNCYELSFLTNNGLPVSCILKLVYAADSKYLVESKSLKLYLNSFNMEYLGETGDLAMANVTSTIKADLSKLLETEVKIALFSKPVTSVVPFVDLQDKLLTELIPSDILTAANFHHFVESPALLKSQLSAIPHSYAFRTDLLRSNCPVTHQPDWGDLFVKIETNHLIDLTSIVAYLISFRKENHFHEEVVEMIYSRFMNIFQPQKLMIAAMYTRRGGIDINPIKASESALIDDAFLNMDVALAKTIRQ